MTIDELNALTTLTAADEVPVWDSEESGEPTKKITASNLAASVKSLGNLIGTGDLDSTPTQGSNKAVTSGGTYTAIQQSTAFSPSVVAVEPFGQWTSYTGGYYSIGKIVFVQVTAVAGNFGANNYFTLTSSLPSPAYPTALAITTTSDVLKGAEAYVDATGRLIVKSGSIALTDQRVVVTGCYIKQ